MVPCAEQCRTVLSQLCKAKENNGTKFCYAQFPFGLVDYKGLKQLQAHHESVHEKLSQEKRWSGSKFVDPHFPLTNLFM